MGSSNMTAYFYILMENTVQRMIYDYVLHHYMRK